MSIPRAGHKRTRDAGGRTVETTVLWVYPNGFVSIQEDWVSGGEPRTEYRELSREQALEYFSQFDKKL